MIMALDGSVTWRWRLQKRAKSPPAPMNCFGC